jgi:precorrin-3B synthase
VSPALDACPGVLILHPARDGLVARIRLPGGYASAPHWRALAALSRDFGDGCVDLTARGNVQLRGLRAADADSLAARAAAAGLLPSAEHDRARNLTASPLSGLGGRPPLRALVAALDAALLAAPEFAALPGRFLFALDDGTGHAGLASSDLGLSYAAPSSATPASVRAGVSPAPTDSASDGPASGGPAGAASVSAGVGPASSGPAKRGPAWGGPAASPASGGPASGGAAVGGFDLFVAGRHVGVRVSAAEAVAAVLAATRAALAAGVGVSVTRIAALPDGGQSVAAAIGGALGAAAAPDARLPLGPALSRPVSAAGAPSARPASHTSHAGTSRSSPGARPPAGSGDPDDRYRFTAGPSGISVAIMEANPAAHGDGPGRVDAVPLVVGAPLGRLTGEQIQLMTGLLAAGEVIRAGVAGRLVIPFSAGPTAGPTAEPDGAGLAGAALARLGAAGLIVTAEDPMGDVTACSGAACERSLADVRAAAGPVSDHRRTHWAGCSRRCGCPPDAEPVVALDATRYRVGGRELSGEGAA